MPVGNVPAGIFFEGYDYRFEQIRVYGYRRACINGQATDPGKDVLLDEWKQHHIEAEVDRLLMSFDRLIEKSSFGGRAWAQSRRDQDGGRSD